jgi:Fic family protein
MKIPTTPPNYDALFEKFMTATNSRLKAVASSIIQKAIGPLTNKGEYIHWDKLQHLQPPEGLSATEWWFAIKWARKSLYKSLPFTDQYGIPMLMATPDSALQKLHAIDRQVGNPISTLNSNMRESYLIGSLMEEAITSSQLEGASTTRKVAKEMLQTNRKPRTKSEQMITNNYQAMLFIQDMKNETITIKAILELHRILTQETLDDPENAGNFRTSEDNIHVWDNRDGQVLHTPPKAEELNYRLQKLCEFANATEKEDTFFIHPVQRAILLHFILAYDHPFVDGNGRTARALFYWSMARQDYSLMEFISISKILKESSGHYARAFLYTETDENDVTYFILYQLDVILKAIHELHSYLDKKAKEMNATEKLLQVNNTLRHQLNYRQISLIQHALKHPDFHYQIEAHRQTYNITYQTARTDLLKLAQLHILLQQKIGKAFVFIAPDDLKKRIESID